MKKYPSKIDFGHLFVILLVMAGSVILIVSPQVLHGLIVNVLLLVCIIRMFTSTYYIIQDGSLILNSASWLIKKSRTEPIK